MGVVHRLELGLTDYGRLSAPLPEVSRADVEAHKCQLMSKFCNVLAVYEGLCSLKQVGSWLAVRQARPLSV